MDHAGCSDSIQWIQTQFGLAKMVNEVPEAFPHHYLHDPVRSEVRHGWLGVL